MVQLLLPFILGQFSRPWTADFMTRNRKNLRWLDQGVICLVVYGAFAELRSNGIETTSTELLIMLALCLLVLIFMLVFTWRLARLLRFSRADEIAIVFCGTKKSLATGVPMATVLFAGQGVGLIVFPLRCSTPFSSSPALSSRSAMRQDMTLIHGQDCEDCAELGSCPPRENKSPTCQGATGNHADSSLG